MSIRDISLPPENRSFVATAGELDAVSHVEAERTNAGRGEMKEVGVGVPILVPGIELDGVGSDVRDWGWWLLLDLFVGHGRWTELSALDPKEIRIKKSEGARIVSSRLKRGLDCVIALCLLVLLLPLLIVIAVAVRLESRGPALFYHSRVGKNGKTFIMWKFRSMRMDALRYDRSPTGNKDERLTRVGRFLRRLSLDELPQLFNVLKGGMSLVGPRPEMPFIVEEYGVIERQRLAVKPGITGLWQISACRALPIHYNVQYDLYYIRNQNVLLDTAILLRTISAVIEGMGAV